MVCGIASGLGLACENGCRHLPSWASPRYRGKLFGVVLCTEHWWTAASSSTLSPLSTTISCRRWNCGSSQAAACDAHWWWCMVVLSLMPLQSHLLFLMMLRFHVVGASPNLMPSKNFKHICGQPIRSSQMSDGLSSLTPAWPVDVVSGRQLAFNSIFAYLELFQTDVSLRWRGGMHLWLKPLLWRCLLICGGSLGCHLNQCPCHVPCRSNNNLPLEQMLRMHFREPGNWKIYRRNSLSMWGRRFGHWWPSFCAHFLSYRCWARMGVVPVVSWSLMLSPLFAFNPRGFPAGQDEGSEHHFGCPCRSIVGLTFSHFTSSPAAPGDLAGWSSPLHPDLEPLLDPVQRQHQCLQHVLSSVTHVPPSQAVPITVEDGVPTIWILHLFSRRRRRGDCHFWCEGCHGILPGYNVHVLSVDTAIDAELGNLDRGPIFDRMLNIIRKRWFAAGLTGPPCETFSAARHLVLEGERHPRPLRSQECPWLLHDRSDRELYQTMVGSRLFMHSIITEVNLVLAGAGSIMEHPTEHPDEERASVQRTQCHQEWVMRLPGAWQHRIEQWRFGSVGIKPTTLRALNLGPPEVVHKALHDNMDPLLTRPNNPLCGRTADGAFRTAAEYPSLLCRALIIATFWGLKHRIAQHGTVQGPDLMAAETTWQKSLYSAACCSSLSGKCLPDFQG